VPWGFLVLPKYIPWAELLHRTVGFEIDSAKCQAPLRLIALVNNQDTAKKILVAMYLPASVPELHPALPPPADRKARDAEDWVNEAERRHGAPEGVDHALCSIRPVLDPVPAPGSGSWTTRWPPRLVRAWWQQVSPTQKYPLRFAYALAGSPKRHDAFRELLQLESRAVNLSNYSC